MLTLLANWDSMQLDNLRQLVVAGTNRWHEAKIGMLRQICAYLQHYVHKIGGAMWRIPSQTPFACDLNPSSQSSRHRLMILNQFTWYKRDIQMK